VKRKKPDVVLAQKAETITNFLFGDHGPFGWNDPCDFQRTFNKASKASRLLFVENVLSRMKVELLGKV